MSSKTLLTQSTTLVLRQDCDRPLALWPFNGMVWSGQDTVSGLCTGELEPVLYARISRSVASPSMKIEVPLVARLTTYIAPKNLKKRGVAFNLPNLFMRELGHCAYCGCQTQRHKANQTNSATFDHIYPRARGGTNEWLNGALACFSCNNKKADRTPEEAGMPLLIKPWIPTPAEMMKLRLHLHPLNVSAWHEFMPSPETPRLEAAMALTA